MLFGKAAQDEHRQVGARALMPASASTPLLVGHGDVDHDHIDFPPRTMSSASRHCSLRRPRESAGQQDCSTCSNHAWSSTMAIRSWCLCVPHDDHITTNRNMSVFTVLKTNPIVFPLACLPSWPWCGERRPLLASAGTLTTCLTWRCPPNAHDSPRACSRRSPASVVPAHPPR